MEKLDNHTFGATTFLRSIKKQLNESIIMDLLSEKLEEPNIHKEQLTERVTRLVEYKMLENKPRNEVISHISDDSQITE